MIELRPYQAEGVDNLRDMYRSGRRAPMFVLATGGGKTIVFCYISEQSVQRGKKVLILVHRIELLRQTQRAIVENTDIRCGIINANYTPDYTAPIQIASIQTLVSNMHLILNLFSPDFIVIDECHHASAGSWRKVIDACPNAWLLGVTATPCRTDGIGLGVDAGGYFDAMVLGPSPNWLMNEGYLVRPRVFGSAVEIDMSDVDILGGDYNKKQLNSKINKPTITGDAVEHYTRICPGEPCVVFCVSVDHAEKVAEAFRAAGYRSVSADGSLPDEERTRSIPNKEKDTDRHE